MFAGPCAEALRRTDPCLCWLPVAASVPRLVATLLQYLPLWSHCPHPRLPFIRTLVMTLDPPRLISPSQDPGLNHTCKVLLQWEVTWSQVPGIRTWTSLGGTVCLPTGSLGLTSSTIPFRKEQRQNSSISKPSRDYSEEAFAFHCLKQQTFSIKSQRVNIVDFMSHIWSLQHILLYIYIFFYNLKKCKNHSYLTGNSFSAPGLELFTCPPISSHGAVRLCLA